MTTKVIHQENEKKKNMIKTDVPRLSLVVEVVEKIVIARIAILIQFGFHVRMRLHIGHSGCRFA